MAVTTRDVAWLCEMAYRIREDTYGLKPWDRTGTHAVFAEVFPGMHLTTVIEMVIAHAADPEARTPGAIKRPFLPARESTLSTDPAKCPDHPDELAMPYCRVHKTESARGYGEDNNPPDPTPLVIPPGITPAEVVRAAAGFKTKATQETR